MFLDLLVCILSIFILEFRTKTEKMACGFTNNDWVGACLPSSLCHNFHALLLFFFLSRDFIELIRYCFLVSFSIASRDVEHLGVALKRAVLS